MEKKKLFSVPMIIVTLVTGIIGFVGSGVATAISNLLSYIPLVGNVLGKIMIVVGKIAVLPAKIVFWVMLILMLIKFISAMIARIKLKKGIQETKEALAQQQTAAILSEASASSDANTEKHLQSLKSFD